MTVAACRQHVRFGRLGPKRTATLFSASGLQCNPIHCLIRNPHGAPDTSAASVPNMPCSTHTTICHMHVHLPCWRFCHVWCYPTCRGRQAHACLHVLRCSTMNCVTADG
jgi:hypothetical protein